MSTSFAISQRACLFAVVVAAAPAAAQAADTCVIDGRARTLLGHESIHMDNNQGGIDPAVRSNHRSIELSDSTVKVGYNCGNWWIETEAYVERAFPSTYDYAAFSVIGSGWVGDLVAEVMWRDPSMGALGLRADYIPTQGHETGTGSASSLSSYSYSQSWRSLAFAEAYVNDKVTWGLEGSLLFPIGVNYQQSVFAADTFVTYYPTDNLSFTAKADMGSSTAIFPTYGTTGKSIGFSAVAEYLIPGTPVSVMVGDHYTMSQGSATNSPGFISYTNVNVVYAGLTYAFGATPTNSLVARDRHGVH